MQVLLFESNLRLQNKTKPSILNKILKEVDGEYTYSLTG